MTEQSTHHQWSDVMRATEARGRRTLAELWTHRPAYRREHSPLRNVNLEFDERMTSGQRIADAFAATMGSWRFIIVQSITLACWVALNVLAFIHHWDPYPFILLNLMLSFQAAYAAPIIMMSQNRQAMKDRLTAEQDYHINKQAEDEVRAILQHLEYQDDLILQILHRMDAHPDDPPPPTRPATNALGPDTTAER